MVPDTELLDLSDGEVLIQTAGSSDADKGGPIAAFDAELEVNFREASFEVSSRPVFLARPIRQASAGNKDLTPLR